MKKLFLLALIQQTLCGWYGQVILVTEDDNHIPYVLLEYSGGNKNIFHVAVQEAKPGERGNAVAQRAFESLKNNSKLKGTAIVSVINTHKVAGSPWGGIEYFDAQANKNVSDIFHVIKISFNESNKVHPYQLFESDAYDTNLTRGAGWVKIEDIQKMIHNGDLKGLIPNELLNKNPKISQRLFDFLKGKNKPSGNVFQNARTFPEIISSLFKTASTGTPQQPTTGTSKWPRSGEFNSIHFYDKGKPYYEFTNTYEVPIDIDGHTWRATEYYYQAGKFYDSWQVYNQGIKGQAPLKQFNPGALQKALQTYQGKKDNQIWQKESLQRMFNALWAKFTQHKNLQQQLLNTKANILVEDAGDHDPFYGAGADYNGANHLGQMLMQIRDYISVLKSENKNIPDTIPFAYTPKTSARDYIIMEQKPVPKETKTTTIQLETTSIELAQLAESFVNITRK